MILTRVIDYDSSRIESFCEKRDSSRVTIFFNVTRVELHYHWSSVRLSALLIWLC